MSIGEHHLLGMFFQDVFCHSCYLQTKNIFKSLASPFALKHS